jgi:hypothetical protein
MMTLPGGDGRAGVKVGQENCCGTECRRARVATVCPQGRAGLPARVELLHYAIWAAGSNTATIHSLSMLTAYNVQQQIVFTSSGNLNDKLSKTFVFVSNNKG